MAPHTPAVCSFRNYPFCFLHSEVLSTSPISFPLYPSPSLLHCPMVLNNRLRVLDLRSPRPPRPGCRASQRPFPAHRGGLLQGGKALCPGGCGFLKSLMPPDELLHTIHRVSKVPAGQVGLLGDQPCFGHRGVPRELAHFQYCHGEQATEPPTGPKSLLALSSGPSTDKELVVRREAFAGVPAQW